MLLGLRSMPIIDEVKKRALWERDLAMHEMKVGFDNASELLAKGDYDGGIAKLERVRELCRWLEPYTPAVGPYKTKIEEALKKGEKVQLVGFGTFEVRERGERKGRNPQTGEEITIAAAKVPAFKAGKALKEAVL